MRILITVLALSFTAGCNTVGPHAQNNATASQRCAAPEYRQFDFWIGEWAVTLPDGNTAGRNRIESVEGGCVLLESWTGAKGGTGRSLNIYDASTQLWHQTWVDATGTLLQLDGGFIDGRMVLVGKQSGVQQRITWTPQSDGSVTQVWESSKDGRTWTTVFNGLYRKK